MWPWGVSKRRFGGAQNNLFKGQDFGGRLACARTAVNYFLGRCSNLDVNNRSPEFSIMAPFRGRGGMRGRGRGVFRGGRGGRGGARGAKRNEFVAAKLQDPGVDG